MKTILFVVQRLLAIIFLLAIAGPARADFVTPSDRASAGVQIRERASANSRSLGTLQPSEQAELSGSVPNWHRIRLPDGRFGFVSKAWTRIQAAAVAGGDFTIHAVDVGTGLAIVVTGANLFLIFDGGSNDDLARGDDNRLLAYMRMVFPELREVHHIILSHPHRDHVELLPDIFVAYEIKNVWDSGAVNDICGYRAFIAAVSEESGVIYRSARHDSGSHPVPFSRKRRSRFGGDQPNVHLSERRARHLRCGRGGRQRDLQCHRSAFAGVSNDSGHVAPNGTAIPSTQSKIEPVSADDLWNSGISPKPVGDFRQIYPWLALFWSPETAEEL